jgi:CBS domain-containing protein
MTQQMLEWKGTGPSLEQLHVGDAMHPGVITCPLATPLRDVARMMATYRIHAVVALGDDERGRERGLWGVVSDLDLVRAGRAGDLDERTAGEVAATPLVMVASDDELGRAAQLMDEHEVTHLVVVDRRSARPIGVLSTLDVARALAGFP